LVAKPADGLNAHDAQDVVQQSIIRVQQETPDDGNGHNARDHRQVVADAEDRPQSSQRAIDSDGGRQTERECREDAEYGVQHGVNRGLDERLVREQGRVIPEADESGAEWRRQVFQAKAGEAHDERRHDGQRHEHNENHQEGCGEDVARGSGAVARC
jgi:hypothetical protein